MNDRSITVIICTLNRVDTTLNTVKYLETQDIQGFEVLVVDQSDIQDPRLTDYQSTNFVYRYEYVEEKGLPNARNVGAGIATGDILVFLDDDVIPTDSLLRDYRRVYSEAGSDVWVVGGRALEPGTRIMRDRDDLIGGYVTKYGKTLKNFESDKTGYCEWVVGANFSVLRDKFFEAGGFDKNFIGNAMLEDSDFGYSVIEAGGKVLFSSEPGLEHLRVITGGTRRFKLYRGMFYRSHNTSYFFKKHKLKRFLPLVFTYLQAIAVKEWLKRSHPITAIPAGIFGFFKGLFTKPQAPLTHK